MAINRNINRDCECSDPKCPVCEGRCTMPADVILYRVDMLDLTGTAFCEECAADAYESGLFTEIGPDEETED